MQGVHSSRANGRYNLHNIEVVILVKSTEQLNVCKRLAVFRV